MTPVAASGLPGEFPWRWQLRCNDWWQTHELGAKYVAERSTQLGRRSYAPDPIVVSTF